MGQVVPALLFAPPRSSYERDGELLWLQTARKDVRRERDRRAPA